MNIVIVDDNRTNLAVLEALVNRIEECEAITFEVPMEGLAWCDENAPDLLMVDYRAPLKIRPRS